MPLPPGRSVSVVEEEESTDHQLHHSSGPLAAESALNGQFRHQITHRS